MLNQDPIANFLKIQALSDQDLHATPRGYELGALKIKVRKIKDRSY